MSRATLYSPFWTSISPIFLFFGLKIVQVVPRKTMVHPAAAILETDTNVGRGRWDSEEHFSRQSCLIAIRSATRHADHLLPSIKGPLLSGARLGLGSVGI